MKKPINRYGLKAYLTKGYDLKPGKRIKYSEPGENGTTYLYEVVKLYPHCILLKDTFDGTRICPGYEKLMLMMLDCKMPDDGQEILVTNGETTWQDTSFIDCDGYYLDSNYDWIEITAWRPLPEPYKEG